MCVSRKPKNQTKDQRIGSESGTAAPRPDSCRHVWTARNSTSMGSCAASGGVCERERERESSIKGRKRLFPHEETPTGQCRSETPA